MGKRRQSRCSSSFGGLPSTEVPGPMMAVCPQRGHCRWVHSGHAYRPGSTANVFRLSHTHPPPRLPFLPTRRRLWLIQVTASLGSRWTRRGQRVPAPVARTYLFRFPVTDRATSLLLRTPALLPLSSRPLPPFFSHPPAPRRCPAALPSVRGDIAAVSYL